MFHSHLQVPYFDPKPIVFLVEGSLLVLFGVLEFEELSLEGLPLLLRDGFALGGFVVSDGHFHPRCGNGVGNLLMVLH